jgi:hypothetical protein
MDSNEDHRRKAMHMKTGRDSFQKHGPTKLRDQFDFGQ